ncbi:CRISPR-associated protein [compost metagenome]
MVISLGPVQEFIAQARKTRDLWFGSYLLSELSRTAALSFRRHGELVMPYFSDEAAEEDLHSLDERLPVANKIIGLTNHTDPEALAKQIYDAVLDQWKRYAQDAQQKLDQYDLILTEMWKRQVKDFIEFNAAWAPLDNEEAYAPTLDRVNQLLAARKTLRDFRQNEPARMYGDKKSSLNPGRESVLKESRYLDYARYGIKKNETLDAVSLVKRLSNRMSEENLGGSKKPAFDSVCDLAFAPFRKLLMNEPELEERALELYRNLLQICEHSLTLPPGIRNATTAGEFDSRMFYPQQMEDLVEEYAYRRIDGRPVATMKTREERIALAKRLRQCITDWSVRHKLAPSPYYAFLLCDGDHIGDRLREVQTPEGHRQWTKRLSQFSAKSREIIQSFGGLFIYGGGDDCMALLPLDTCLEATDTLRCHFSEIMSDEMGKNMPFPQPSLSAGLVIAHMLEPLGEVRELAEEAERGAKKFRNRLFVHVQKRSGSNKLQVSLPWEENPSIRLTQFKELYLRQEISVQLAHDLRLLHAAYAQRIQQLSLSKDKAENETLEKELLAKEVERLLRKKKLDKVVVYDESKNNAKVVLSEWLGSYICRDDHSPLERLNRLTEQIMLAIALIKTEVDKDAGAY